MIIFICVTCMGMAGSLLYLGELLPFTAVWLMPIFGAIYGWILERV
jgi:hypothetical protein